MKYFYTYFFICAIFLGSFVSAVLSYPVFSMTTTLTPKQQIFINDANELENNVTYSTNTLATANLDWFETVNALFPFYTDTRVVDMLSKTIYKVQRTGGHFHADVEPVDVENKNKFYNVYNQKWSWERRPVFVEINGIWVAGSINGMPHGYSLITNNEQDGHTCIHFLNSKTHGTKKVDESHQNAISYAVEHKNDLIKILNQ